jgi:hypothetical protein
MRQLIDLIVGDEENFFNNNSIKTSVTIADSGNFEKIGKIFKKLHHQALEGAPRHSA